MDLAWMARWNNQWSSPVAVKNPRERRISAMFHLPGVEPLTPALFGQVKPHGALCAVALIIPFPSSKFTKWQQKNRRGLAVRAS